MFYNNQYRFNQLFAYLKEKKKCSEIKVMGTTERHILHALFQGHSSEAMIQSAVLLAGPVIYGALTESAVTLCSPAILICG